MPPPRRLPEQQACEQIDEMLALAGQDRAEINLSAAAEIADDFRASVEQIADILGELPARVERR